MNKLLIVVPRDTVSCVNGNPQIYNNVAELNRRCEILSQQDPAIKDVVFNIVGFFDRAEEIIPGLREGVLKIFKESVQFKLGDNVEEVQKLTNGRAFV